jgi:hypothetical protein
MAKEKKTKTGGPDPNETTVELHVPPNLYATAKKLYDTDKDLFSEVVRAVFARDDFYGITAVKLVRGVRKSNVGTKSARMKKTCDIGPLP